MALVARHILRPLDTLTCSVQAVARGDYSRRLDTTRADEIGDLARAVDALTQQLDSSRATLERRLTDISAAEARFETLFESAEIAIWNEDFTDLAGRLEILRHQGVVDLRAHLRQTPELVWELLACVRVRHVNRASLRLFGARDEAEILSGLARIVTPETHGVLINKFCAVWARESVFQSETVLRTLGGERRVVLLSFPVPQTAEGLAAVPVSFLDVTPIRKAEDRLRRNTLELERSNSDLESFAYASAHDLREPLRNITSYTTLLSRRLADRLEPEEQEFFHYVHQGALRMDDLVCDLLEFSRIGRPGRPLEPVDLADVTERLLRAPIEAGAETEGAASLPVVLGIPADLEKLYTNLLGNALKYRSPDRPLRLTFGAVPEGSFWRLWLRDNGIGLQPGQGYEERIFRLFQRLHGRAEYGGGTGIGLAICRKVVEHHGGRMWVESPGLDQGTTFFFTLPAPPPRVGPPGSVFGRMELLPKDP
ncbi:sensor histidine kinase [Pararhodospirillum photometricum]|nr:ATP-binding protein [Pararhodospirillum photometricum]